MKKSFILSLLIIFASSGAFSQNSKLTGKIDFPDQFTQSKISQTLNDGLRTVGESFEGDFPPEGWLINDYDGDSYNWHIEGGEAFPAQEGENCVTSESWEMSAGPLFPDNWLITPAFTVAEGDVISWWVAAQDPDFAAEHYAVLLSTTTPDINEFDVSLHSETLTNSEWTMREYDLLEYAGQTLYAAFRHYNCSDQFVMKLDNVIFPGATTGVKEPVMDEVRIFPNPSSDVVNIQNVAGAEIFVYNMFGDEITSIKKANQFNTINFSGYAEGSYFVKIISDLKITSQVITIVR